MSNSLLERMMELPGFSIGFPLVAASCALYILTTTAAFTQPSMSSANVVKALTPAFSNTRSLVSTSTDKATVSAEEREFLNAIPTRGLRFDTVKKVEKIIAEKKLPALDMEIKFKFASAEIAPSSHSDLKALGDALQHPSLLKSRILLNGHTDAMGSEEYNLQLSKKRANAVRSFLTTQYNIKGERLIAIGSGERRLKLKDLPAAEANRRVEIVNLGS